MTTKIQLFKTMGFYIENMLRDFLKFLVQVLNGYSIEI